MNKKFILVAIAAVVLLILIFVLSEQPSGIVNLPGGGNGVAEVAPVTRESAPDNIVVPDVSGEANDKNIAVPENVSAADPSGKTDYRNFNLSLNGGKFAPDTIAVYIGDVANINITAVDRNYDFFQPDYGLKGNISKGSTLKVQFAATAAGKFAFFCESCGGPEKGPVGRLIVAPK